MNDIIRQQNDQIKSLELELLTIDDALEDIAFEHYIELPPDATTIEKLTQVMLVLNQTIEQQGQTLVRYGSYHHASSRNARRPSSRKILPRSPHAIQQDCQAILAEYKVS